MIIKIIQNIFLNTHIPMIKRTIYLREWNFNIFFEPLKREFFPLWNGNFTNRIYYTTSTDTEAF